MKILLIGNGGRENALAWKIYNSPSFKNTNSRIYCASGNPGINRFADPLNIDQGNLNDLLNFAKKESIDLTVVGPELPLSSGIVNIFEEKGLRIFGPVKEAAEIESSKIFSKKLMAENNIPTAVYKNFSGENPDEALEYLNKCEFPVVIKADGLAAGKGVIIAGDITEAEKAIDEIINVKIFGAAGNNFIIEEFLEGEEISVFVITDGIDYKILPYSQDHKKILDGDRGKNTGGMGAIAPILKFTDEVTEIKIRKKVIEPTLKALKDSGREFRGCLYCGLMMVKGEPYVIEYNCRFGDPETQAVLPLIKSDFLELLMASASVNIKNYSLEINRLHSCCVVLASEGYPDKYDTDKEIKGIDKNIESESSIVFQSGTKYSENNKIVTSGGRVLSVVGLSENSTEIAVKNAYERIEEIDFENKYFRKDIGYRQLKV